MTNPELERTQALVARLADLQARMQAARLVGAEVTTVRKVAATIDDGLRQAGLTPLEIAEGQGEQFSDTKCSTGYGQPNRTLSRSSQSSTSPTELAACATCRQGQS